MEDQKNQEEASMLLERIATVSKDPFGPYLVDEVLALTLEEKTSLLPKIGLAFAKIQSLYRFMEDSINVDRRNREDDLRPAALREVLGEIPFLHPECLQINMLPLTSDLAEATEDFETVEKSQAIGDDDVEAPPLASPFSIFRDAGQASLSSTSQNHHVPVSRQKPSPSIIKSSTSHLEDSAHADGPYELSVDGGLNMDSGSRYPAPRALDSPLSTDGPSSGEVFLGRPLMYTEGTGLSIEEYCPGSLHNAYDSEMNLEIHAHSASLSGWPLRDVLVEDPEDPDWHGVINDAL